MDFITSYLAGKSISTHLDIGGGTGHRSKEICKVFNNAVYILEGSSEDNSKKNKTALRDKYNSSADNFQYYWEFDELKEKISQTLDGYEHYLINAENIKIDKGLKFDLITSLMSCGFHYPLSTYYDLLHKHSHKDTVMIFDLRIRKNGTTIVPPEIEVEEVLYTEPKKYQTSVIRFRKD